MRTLVALAIVILAGSARAEPKPPDLTFAWSEGEHSKDSSVWTTTIAMTGTKLHYERTYSGRYSGMPNAKPATLDAEVKDPKQVAAAIAALDKLPVRKTKQTESALFRTGCLTRGKVQRCETRYGNDDGPDTTELKAMRAVMTALLDGVKVP
jgi:hypothetical protein